MTGAKPSPKPAVKTPAPKKAAPLSRTAEMLRDIRAKGEELSAGIDHLLRRLGWWGWNVLR